MKKITGIVKEYAWGGTAYLPQLLARPNPLSVPHAEYWLGTHPAGMAQVADSEVPLIEHLSNKTLPFLFKVLDVKDMLSIQVHPDLQQAQRGFAAEEKQGEYDRSHPNRTYRDSNHKPELMVALSDFYLVQGFRDEDGIDQILQSHPEFESLRAIHDQNGLEGLVRHWMRSPQDEINSVLRPLGKRIKPLYQEGQLTKDQIDFWAARAYFTFNRKGVCDRGILMLYLMNLIQLSPGEGMFQYPGQLHAYLEGQNVECMATSDNVVRGGLTQKWIAIDELLNITDFSPNRPQKILPLKEAPGAETYPIPSWCDDFRMYRINGTGELPDPSRTRLVFCLHGSVHLESKSSTLNLLPGEAAIVSDDQACQFKTDSGEVFVCS